MLRELAQAIDDLAQTGRLSDDSRENIDFLLTGDEPVSDESVQLSDEPKTKTTTTAGGQKK